MTYLRTMLALLMTAGTAAAVNSQQGQDMETVQAQERILVAYFSATGTTARAAGKLAEMTGGDIWPIIPVQPYTSADLDWHDRRSRSSVEMNDPESRPEIKGRKDDIGSYDVIFIGYPVWWDLAPRIINTFIEAHDLDGRKVIPFATSGGSTIGNSVMELEKAYPGIKWEKGRLLNRPDEKSIGAWLDELGY